LEELIGRIRGGGNKKQGRIGDTVKKVGERLLDSYNRRTGLREGGSQRGRHAPFGPEKV